MYDLLVMGAGKGDTARPNVILSAVAVRLAVRAPAEGAMLKVVDRDIESSAPACSWRT